MKKLLSIVLSVVLIMTVFISCEAVDDVLASTYMSLGEKYLTDLDYENAIVYFNKVIEVEPKNTEAYLGEAEAYVALDDIDSATAILKTGIEIVDDASELVAMTGKCCSKIKLVTTAKCYGSDITYENEYDSNGNLIKYTCYSNGTVQYWYEYENNSNGNFTREICYNSDGSISIISDYEYDSNESLIRYTSYNSSGDITSWIDYEYDLNGNKIKETVYRSSGNIECSYEYEYEYDLNGNMTKETTLL